MKLEYTLEDPELKELKEYVDSHNKIKELSVSANLDKSELEVNIKVLVRQMIRLLMLNGSTNVSNVKLTMKPGITNINGDDQVSLILSLYQHIDPNKVPLEV